MGPLMVICVGVLVAVGTYLVLRRSLVKVVMGIALLGHGANLLIYTASEPVRGRPPLIREGDTLPPAPFADPLPAALILTAIVIGFAIVAYTVVLVKRTYIELGTDDVDRLSAEGEAGTVPAGANG